MNDQKAAWNIVKEEKQAILPSGSIINYVDSGTKGTAVLLLHGQTGAWQSYRKIITKLYRTCHVFALDLYGHGKSSHDESLYYLRANGDDIIWFIDHVIQEPTVIAGHSNGALLAAYVAAYGGKRIKGCVLEDPPVFSTEPGEFEKTFAYVDTYKVMHEYLHSDKKDCWPVYYLAHCYWAKTFMPKAVPAMVKTARKYREKHPDKPVRIFYMPNMVNDMFEFVDQYDLLYGEHFYNYTWHSGIRHAKLMSDIHVPTVYLHAKESYTKDGILQCAASLAQATEAIGLMQGNCQFFETENSQHDIHNLFADWYIDKLKLLL